MTYDNRKWTFTVTFTLACIPIAALIYQTCINFVDVPFWDQWEFVPMLMKFEDHTLSFSDLFQAHHEHRIFFPRVIMLLLARLSDWNTAYEIAFIIFLAVAILGALTYIAAISFNDIPAISWLWVMPALAILVFSLRQHQNWLWGWQITMYLNVAAFCWAVVLLSHKRESLPLFFSSLALAFVSTLSLANGLLFWIIAFPLLLLHRRRKTLKVLIWIATSVGVYTAYFYQFQRSAADPPIVLSFSYLMDASIFMLINIGSLVVKEKESKAIQAAVIAMVCLLYTSSILVRKYKNAGSLMPVWTLALFSVASAALISLGRAGFGPEYALESRYTTLMTPLWSTVLILLFYLLVKQFYDRGSNAKLHMASTLILFVVITISAEKASISSISSFREIHRVRTLGKVELLRLPQRGDEKHLENLCWSPDLTILHGAWLKQHKLSLFRSTADQ